MTIGVIVFSNLYQQVDAISHKQYVEEQQESADGTVPRGLCSEVALRVYDQIYAVSPVKTISSLFSLLEIIAIVLIILRVRRIV